MNLNLKDRHAELGSASYKSKPNETLKRVQGDTSGLRVNFLDAPPLKLRVIHVIEFFKKLQSYNF